MLGSSAVLYIGFLLRTAFRQSCADLFKCFPHVAQCHGHFTAWNSSFDYGFASRFACFLVWDTPCMGENSPLPTLNSFYLCLAITLKGGLYPMLAWVGCAHGTFLNVCTSPFFKCFLVHIV